VGPAQPPAQIGGGLKKKKPPATYEGVSTVVMPVDGVRQVGAISGVKPVSVAGLICRNLTSCPE